MADIFRGYLPSNGKIPLTSVKDSSNWLSEPPEQGDYVGILNENIIQVDFDSEEDSKIALEVVEAYKLKCDILKTTRGVHLYFIDDGYTKSQSVGIFTAMGIPCDIGLGKKDRVVPLRTTKETEEPFVEDGVAKKRITKVTKTRNWVQTYSELEELPPYFRPIGKHDFQLRKTESRNDTLYRYILTLQSKEFTKTEIRLTYKVINNHVLYKKLSDKEIDTITRDGSLE